MVEFGVSCLGEFWFWYFVVCLVYGCVKLVFVFWELWFGLVDFGFGLLIVVMFSWCLVIGFGKFCLDSFGVWWVCSFGFCLFSCVCVFDFVLILMCELV